ncbi:hypothetical protein K435DRAFT_318411 [Dendrothele bispora CBS 962.96]|uniref:Uncharacterized protein n=1 Tax=Dendrothele bispora (strain CBS 962.96) TaxID=1314807 RepID=A0A4S8LH61_DENBC|nr:hypothetical protein K435DRAFT_318411 [Dendrothele bispora CBS 962.96]
MDRGFGRFCCDFSVIFSDFYMLRLWMESGSFLSFFLFTLQFLSLSVVHISAPGYQAFFLLQSFRYILLWVLSFLSHFFLPFFLLCQGCFLVQHLPTCTPPQKKHRFFFPVFCTFVL